MSSHLEAAFALIVRAAGLPAPEAEYRFAPGRRFRFDFAWPDQRVAVEVEGGTWAAGRHTRGSGYAADCVKYNLATVLGWRVLRYTGDMLNDPDAVADQVRALLAQTERACYNPHTSNKKPASIRNDAGRHVHQAGGDL